MGVGNDNRPLFCSRAPNSDHVPTPRIRAPTLTHLLFRTPKRLVG